MCPTLIFTCPFTLEPRRVVRALFKILFKQKTKLMKIMKTGGGVGLLEAQS